MCSVRPRLVGLELYTVTDNRDCVQRVALDRPMPAVNKKQVAKWKIQTAVIDRKARYSLKIEILAYPTCIRGPLGKFPSEYCHAVWCGKTRMVGLPNGGKILKIYLFVLTQSTHPAMWYVALGWHAIKFAQTSAILEFYIWFPFPHITAVDMSFSTSQRNFIQIGPPSAEKNDVMSIFKMAYLSHLGF